MQAVVVDKPYVPVTPYRSTFWASLIVKLAPWYLKRRYGVTQVEVVHGERLKASIDSGCGVLITPNHSRDEDPLVLGTLSSQVGKPFYLMASWHLFVQGKVMPFLLRRAG